MSPGSASDRVRPVVGLGLTEGVATELGQRFALHRPPASFDAEAPVIVVQDARVDVAEMDRQPGLLAPHIAGSTQETWDEAGALLMQNLDHFFSTGRSLTPAAP